MGKVVLPQEKCTNFFPASVSSENIYKSNILWVQQMLYRNICIYTNTFMRAITDIEKETMHLK